MDEMRHQQGWQKFCKAANTPFGIATAPVRLRVPVRGHKRKRLVFSHAWSEISCVQKVIGCVQGPCETGETLDNPSMVSVPLCTKLETSDINKGN